MTRYLSADDEQLLAIRRTIIVAIASDEMLMERLVLKGGNALDIIYRLGERSSLDIDFSMARGFEGDELEGMTVRLFRALRDRFDSLRPTGYVVFDERFEQRPRLRPGQVPEAEPTIWGGYNATFKLIAKNLYRSLGGQPGTVPTGRVLEALRQQAQVTGAGSERVFYIEISKFEYIEGRVLKTIDDYECYVYSPAMIAAEKLRALCQQLASYEPRKNPAPRPRDFFDIYTIATKANCDITAPEHHPLVVNMFAAKQVPLGFLTQLSDTDVRDFHAQEWSAVQNAVRGATNPFSFYFGYTVDTATRLFASLQERGFVST